MIALPTRRWRGGLALGLVRLLRLVGLLLALGLVRLLGRVRLLLALRRDCLLGGLRRLVRRPGLLGLRLVRRLLPPLLLRLPGGLLGLRRARLPVHCTVLVLRSSVGVLVLIHRRSFDP
ncbi:hypothetical protein A4X17_07490 [Plantibacter sp. H53]|nr:hypothetical protein A4X17_07490 [Plantibacter sp. H53]